MIFATEVIRPLLKQNKTKNPEFPAQIPGPGLLRTPWADSWAQSWVSAPGSVRSLASLARPVRGSGGLRLPLVAPPAAAASPPFPVIPVGNPRMKKTN